VVVVSRSKSIPSYHRNLFGIDDIGPARSNSADCGIRTGQMRWQGSACSACMHVSCVRLFAFLTILPCVLYSDMYASAYNLVLLIRVQTKALSLIDQTSYRKEMDAIEPYSS
jgi:hypothetical protein